MSLSFFQFLTLGGEGFDFLSKVQREKMTLRRHLEGKMSYGGPGSAAERQTTGTGFW